MTSALYSASLVFVSVLVLDAIVLLRFPPSGVGTELKSVFFRQGLSLNDRIVAFGLPDCHGHERRGGNDTVVTEDVADDLHDLALLLVLRMTNNPVYGAERLVKRVEL